MLFFAPDADDITPEVLTEVSAVPTARGYKSPPAGVTTNSSALTDPSQGAALALKLDGTTRTLAWTAAALWELSAGSWSDVSRGGGYTLGSHRGWFAQFGNTTLAGNKVTPIQQSSSGAFADVAASPLAACADTAQGFLCLGDIDDTGAGIGTSYGDQGHRWWTSALYSPTTTWAPSVATQATTGLLIDTPGNITAVKSLNGQVIYYKAKSIYVGDFVGPPAVLQFRVAANDVGCAARDAVVLANYTHYFPGDDDFYSFDGTRPVRIGSGIREWFFARMNRQQKATIRALHDRTNNLIMWWYPRATATALSSAVVYHYPTGRWGAFDLTITDVLEAVTSAITYSDLGTLFTTYADSELALLTYGSSFWIANTSVLAYFDATDTLQSLSGNAATMSLQTGWIGDESTVSLCARVRPRFRVKPSGGSIVHSHIMALGDAAEVEASADINGDRFDVLASARYHRFATTFTGLAEVDALGPKLLPVGDE